MKILFAVRVGNEDWREEVITEDEDRIEAAKEWASANGFDRFRVAEIDLDTPPKFGKESLKKPEGVRDTDSIFAKTGGTKLVKLTSEGIATLAR